MDKFIDSVRSLLGKMSFLPNDEIKLAVIGGLLITAIFLIALIISAGSKINGLRKRLISVTVRLANTERVDEDNVDAVYSELKRLPESVAYGWGRFLEQKSGYPSDYIPSRDVITEREYGGKNAAGKVIFTVLSVIVWALTAILVTAVCKTDLASVGLVDFTNNFSLVGSILSTVLIPVAVFVIFYFVMAHVYKKQRRRLEMCFASFQDILDEKVMVSEKEEVEYEDDELGDITQKVEELIDGRMDDEGVVEVITVPSPLPREEETIAEENDEEIVFEEVVEPVAEIPVAVEVPVEEAAAEDAAEQIEEVPMTKEEEARYLAVLLTVVDRAMQDPETTDDDLEEIAVLIETARQEGFRDEGDQQILEECLIKLASRYYS